MAVDNTPVDGALSSLPNASGRREIVWAALMNALTGAPLTDVVDRPNAASRIPSSAASNNPTVAKASTGKAFRAVGNNAKASVVYLKLYNKATAPTVGTDIPVLTIPIAASSIFDKTIDGMLFSAGIAYGFTTDAADNGTTALASGDILGFSLTYV